MAIDERDRHRLHQRLDDVLGVAEAATLMSHLPPAGWLDVTTNQQLSALEARMDARFAAVDARFESLEGRMDARFETVDARFDVLLTTSANGWRSACAINCGSSCSRSSRACSRLRRW